MSEGSSKLTPLEMEKRNQLKSYKPLVYDKVVKFDEKLKNNESIAIIQLQYNYICNFKKRYTKRACAVCDSTTSKFLFRQTFSEMSSGSLLQGYDVVVCEDCGFGYADYIPPQADFDAHYRDMSKYEYQDQDGKETEYDLDRFQAITESIIPYLPDRNVRLLDIGCATGRLLALFKEKGFGVVMGLDPSPVCSQAAQRLYGVRVRVGTIYEIKEVMAHEQSFDCVILTGVLEHIRDIHQALLRIRGVMANGGLIFIEVPDATDFACWPDAPFQEFSTEHINFFSKISLDNLMYRCGFSRVSSRQTPRDQSFSTVIPVVSAIYRKQKDIQPPSCIQDIETASGLADYINKSQEIENGIRRAIEKLVQSAQPIVVWGVGTHTLHLLTTSQLSQANICAFVDSNPLYHGKQLKGRPILAPSELEKQTEAILISSRVFQPAIEKQIREELRLSNDIIKLYTI
jgi:SAM-dependent methyltransferase